MEKLFTCERRKIDANGRMMDLLILRPGKNRKNKEKTPGILWVHGGGYRRGTARKVFRSRALNLVIKYGAVVISPEYRLSGEAPYPAALEDCYAALKYLKEHSNELGINSSQIMVGGESAGGGMTAALCMYARDLGEVNVAYQMPLYPMLDNIDTPSSKDNHDIIWNTRKNHAAWKAYLGDLWNQGEKVPAYAAPARQKDYSNLPPAYTFIGELEPFYCEVITFIENLRKAGVEAKIDIYPRCPHAFDMHFPFLPSSHKAAAAFERQYLYAAEHYFAPQKN